MTLRLLLALCAAGATVAATAQDQTGPWVDPSSEWRMDPIQRAEPVTPQSPQDAPAPAHAEPAGPQPVATLPTDTAPAPPPIPEIVGPDGVAPPPLDPVTPKNRRLRMDSSFSALEAVTPPPMTPTGDSSANPDQTPVDDPPPRPRAGD